MNNQTLPTAKQAKEAANKAIEQKKSEATKKEQVAKDLVYSRYKERIVKTILNFANDGEFEIKVETLMSSSLPQRLINELREAGFAVKRIVNDEFGSVYKINW